MQLARQAQRKFADVHAFLHLAKSFLSYLADFAGDDVADIGLGAAQLLAPQPHQLTAHGGWHQPPLKKGLCRAVNDLRQLRSGQGGQPRKLRTINGRMHGDVMAAVVGQINAAAAQHGLEVGSVNGGHGLGVDGSIEQAMKIRA